MSATAKVIATPELLEVILLQLDLPSLLLRAPLVNRYFFHLIETSIAIQKALFFIPEPRLPPLDPSPPQPSADSPTTNTNGTTNRNKKKKSYSHHHHRHQKITLNPFLQKPFSLWFPQDPKPPFSPSPSSSPSPTSSPSLSDQISYAHNHQVEDALPLHLAPPPPLNPQRHTIPTFLSLPSLTHPHHRAAIMHPSASWRRMLVQQPAAQKLGWLSWGLDFSPEQGMVVPIVMKGIVGPELLLGGESMGAADENNGDGGGGGGGGGGKKRKGKEWICGGGSGGGCEGGEGLRMGQLYDLTQGRIECFPRDFGGYAFRIVRAEGVAWDSDEKEDEEEEEEEEEEGEEEEDEEDGDDLELPLPQNRADQETRALMRQMGDDVEILFDERGYYPARVLGRAVGDVVESGEYRHPARRRIDIKLERADWPTSVAAN